MRACRGGGDLELAPQGFWKNCYPENEHPRKFIQLLKTKSGLLRQKSRNDRFGFTLAEVLITLGIIGVVAALTMPVLIQSYQKHVVATSLRKAYAELNVALQMAISDYGDISTWDYNSASEVDLWAKKYIEPYFNVLSSQACANNKAFKCAGVPNAASLGGNTDLYIGYMAAPYVIVKNGGAAKALAFYRYGAYEEIRVFVYLKIPSKRKAEKGKEVFTFVLKPSKDTAFKPFGMTGTVPYTTGVVTKDKLLNGPIRTGGCFKESGGPDYYGPGDGCGAVIMLDEWKIGKDYPW